MRARPPRRAEAGGTERADPTNQRSLLFAALHARTPLALLVISTSFLARLSRLKDLGRKVHSRADTLMDRGVFCMAGEDENFLIRSGARMASATCRPLISGITTSGASRENASRPVEPPASDRFDGGDEQALRELTVRMLQRLGYKVLSAALGQRGANVPAD